MKEERNNKQSNRQRFALKLDMRHYFPDGRLPEQLREALECYQQAETWAFYLECDAEVIREQARLMSEATNMTYRQAIDKVSFHMFKGQDAAQCRASVSACLLPTKPKPANNRAARRKAERERRHHYDKRK